MTDRPIPAKILLALVDSKVTGEEFIGLSTTLYTQNLIFSQPRELRVNGSDLELTIVFRDDLSFKAWTKDSKVVDIWQEKFDKFLIKKPETIRQKDVLVETDDVKNCVCEKSTFFILQGRSLSYADELTCSDCLGQVSYSKVPLGIKIEDWQTKHQRFYLNWLESGLFEEEAYRELTNYKDGKLNLAGENIRKQISDYFGIPVYISYFVYDADGNHPCLLCGQNGTDSGLKRPKKICKTCNTIFAYND